MTQLHKLYLAIVACSFTAVAHADVIDFIGMADGAYGESAWDPMTLTLTGVTMTISGSGPNGGYAYLDAHNAGLGVCKALYNPADANSPNSGSGHNLCSPASDDNVTNGEYFNFVFDSAVVINNFWFNNNHDGGFNAPDMITIGGAEYNVSRGYAGGANGIGAFTVAAGQILTVQYFNQQFYISGMEVNAVPEPGTLGLLGAGLFALGAMRRRRREL